jgi:dTDP-4-amino-4,6-dideoxy-D-galactose acyltransferase
MRGCRLLEWDSEFFGFAVAQITVPTLDRHQLGAVLSELRQRDVRLAYWPADSTGGAAVRQVAEELGGRLVDMKTTFVVDLASLVPAELTLHARVEPYGQAEATPEMRALAVESGVFSRFAVDPNIPRHKFIELYSIWITRAVAREIADEVLVIRDAGGTVVGMVTMGNTSGPGAGGLLAVAPAYRRHGYGETLVRAKQRWWIAQGQRQGRVVTQAANTAACRLYQRCGYRVVKVEPYYHFWLR